MSVEYPNVLLNRALNYLKSAERNLAEGLYDVACVEAEIAAQLALKALIAKRGVEPPRVHSIRGLMAFIVEKKLLPEEALYEIRELSRRLRTELIVLERSREAGQYSIRPVDHDEADIAVKTAREVIDLVHRLWRLDT